MPKGEGESILLALSWQVLPGATKGNSAFGHRQCHSIGGFVDGSQRSPRKFVPKTTLKSEVEEYLPLPLFVLSTWGIALPEPPSAQKPNPPEGPTSAAERDGPAPPPARSRSAPSQPSVSAFKEAESFFGNSYRPMVPKLASPVIGAGGSAGSDGLRSAGDKRSSTASNCAPLSKDSRIDATDEVTFTALSDPPSAQQQQQKQQHDRRRSCWAKQLDSSYLQS
jgi:hypothetical protein